MGLLLDGTALQKKHLKSFSSRISTYHWGLLGDQLILDSPPYVVEIDPWGVLIPTTPWATPQPAATVARRHLTRNKPFSLKTSSQQPKNDMYLLFVYPYICKENKDTNDNSNLDRNETIIHSLAIPRIYILSSKHKKVLQSFDVQIVITIIS